MRRDEIRGQARSPGRPDLARVPPDAVHSAPEAGRTRTPPVSIHPPETPPSRCPLRPGDGGRPRPRARRALGGGCSFIARLETKPTKPRGRSEGHDASAMIAEPGRMADWEGKTQGALARPSAPGNGWGAGLRGRRGTSNAPVARPARSEPRSAAGRARGTSRTVDRAGGATTGQRSGLILLSKGKSLSRTSHTLILIFRSVK